MRPEYTLSGPKPSLTWVAAARPALASVGCREESVSKDDQSNCDVLSALLSLQPQVRARAGAERWGAQTMPFTSLGMQLFLLLVAV